MDKETKNKAQRKELRHEVFEERYTAKARVDYYGERASRAQTWVTILTTISLLSSSSAILSVLRMWGDETIVITSLVAAVAAVLSAVAGLTKSQAVFLAAQFISRNQETKWDTLWLDLNTGRYSKLDEIFTRFEALRTEDASVQQIVQPHIQKSKRVIAIQKKIRDHLEELQNLREGNDDRRESDIEHRPESSR